MLCWPLEDGKLTLSRPAASDYLVLCAYFAASYPGITSRAHNSLLNELAMALAAATFGVRCLVVGSGRRRSRNEGSWARMWRLLATISRLPSPRTRIRSASPCRRTGLRGRSETFLCCRHVTLGANAAVPPPRVRRGRQRIDRKLPRHIVAVGDGELWHGQPPLWATNPPLPDAGNSQLGGIDDEAHPVRRTTQSRRPVQLILLIREPQKPEGA